MAQFRPGDRVRVRTDPLLRHTRTPGYLKGKIGWVERLHGEFRNPESLAYGGDGLPKRNLYLVKFPQTDVWNRYGAFPQDRVYADIFEHWLEPSQERGEQS